ncbi:MAG: hypothetical protein RLZ14_2309 [Actinomycetota bacterium]
MIRQLVVTVPASESELASDALWGLGVVAVEERPSVDGTTVELWTSVGDTVEVALPWPCRFEDVDESVADTWRSFAAPVWIDTDLVVCPAWVEFDAADGVTVLRIEPGSTFGMGDHPTTRLSLAAAKRVVQPGHRVLDVGCGSGVLAVGAMTFGAAHATGIDIAPAAVATTLANAAANGVDVAVSTMPLDEVTGQFDVVLANILAPVLVALAADLRRVTAHDGRLVISGVLVDGHQHVLEALRPMVVERVDELDGWAAVELRW